MSNYQQPDYRVPSAPGVTVQPHQFAAASGNPLALTWPLQVYVEKLSSADDPQGTIRGGRSGH